MTIQGCDIGLAFAADTAMLRAASPTRDRKIAREMSESSLLVNEQDGVLTLTLNRPASLNSLTRTLLAEMAEALMMAEEESRIRAILMTGAGRAFSAGQDLQEKGVMDQDDVADALLQSLERFYHPVITSLREIPKPVVVAVNGIAAGAGANIALAGDIVLASEEASFLEAFARIGLLPDAGGTYTLPRLVGGARARGLAMLAEPIGAKQAEDWGLIWKAVPANKLMEEALGIATRLAQGPTKAYAAMKLALAESDGSSLHAQLSRESQLQASCVDTEDFKEGVAAFREKRKANFQGK